MTMTKSTVSQNIILRVELEGGDVDVHVGDDVDGHAVLRLQAVTSRDGHDIIFFTVEISTDTFCSSCEDSWR